MCIAIGVIKNQDKVIEYNGTKAGKKQSTLGFKVKMGVFLSFSILWTGLAGYGVGSQLYSLLSDYSAGKYSIVEGQVEKLDYNGKYESFSINGVSFRYSESSVTPGFNNTNGPIREGLDLRISYIKNTILKIEVLEAL